MSPRRVFKGHPNRPRQIYRITLTGDIQEDELTIFLQEAKKALSNGPFKLFERLARLPPARRLAVNLKSMLDLAAKQDISDVLREGLDKQEQHALTELQVKNLTPRLREIGHGLLCIDERFEFIELMGTRFRELVTKKGGFINDE